jgi:long-chain acyl-CoA synthetase
MLHFETIAQLFTSVVEAYGPTGRVALRQRTRSGVREYTHAALKRDVDRAAAGLLSLGVSKGDRVGIISESRPEWVVADHAVQSIGAVDVPVFPSLTSEQAQYVFNHAGASVVVASNELQVRKILSILDNIPSVRTVIAIVPSAAASSDARVIGFDELFSRGEAYLAANPASVDTARTAVRPDDLATIIYTSGTTGTPKGVMLTNRNLISNVRGALAALPVLDERDVVLSYLPLCHSFERIASYFMFAKGVEWVLAESIETVAEDLRTVRPTIMTTVPRLLERMQGKVMRRMDTMPPMRKKLMKWAFAAGQQHLVKKRARKIDPLGALQCIAADKLVFEKIRALVGGRIRFFVSGGAPLPPALGEFFEALGLVVIEGYGLTESSPIISVNRVGNHRYGTVGHPIEHVEVTFAGDGELLARGPNIMRGYWQDEAATSEAIDAQAWLHTGDIGEFDSEGRIRITDRKKHLFVSSGGKNIAPQLIENVLSQSALVDQVFLIGDKRAYITALIVPDFEALRELAKGHNVAVTSPADLVADPVINALVEQELDRLQKPLANYERVRKFTLLPVAFTVESGEMTPTLKLKRAVVEKNHAARIDAMY